MNSSRRRCWRSVRSRKSRYLRGIWRITIMSPCREFIAENCATRSVLVRDPLRATHAKRRVGNRVRAPSGCNASARPSASLLTTVSAMHGEIDSARGTVRQAARRPQRLPRLPRELGAAMRRWICRVTRAHRDPPLVVYVGAGNAHLEGRELRCARCGALLRTFRRRPTEGSPDQSVERTARVTTRSTGETGRRSAST